MTSSGPTLVVAARSARMLAEAAAREGYPVIALDAFGDADTRRAARAWHSIAAPDDGTAPRVDARRLLDVLATLAQQAAPLGWIAGSDLEGEPGLLEAGARLLPLIGSAPADVERVRDPRVFFGALDALGIAHPTTRFDAAPREPGWLRKSARGCGGWHIRRAEPGLTEAAPDAHGYLQREAPGRPMSALFVAGLTDPQDAHRQHRLVGCNELIVRPYGAHPHVYRGAIGPVALPEHAQASLADAIDALVGHFALRGLCSLDFLWHDGAWSLLEVNPRASASMALYPDAPLVAWQLQACGYTPRADGHAPATHRVRGIETVFARRAFTLGAADATALHARDDCHDLPHAGARFAPGDPVCSVSVLGNNPPEVHAALSARRQALRDQLAA